MLYRALGWLYGKIITKTHNIILSILAAGPIPKHVAFVMDGNRRYARSTHKQIYQGHAAGYDALKKVGVLRDILIDSFRRADMHCVGAGDVPLSECEMRLCIRVFDRKL